MIEPHDLPEPALGSARLERQWSNIRDRSALGAGARSWRWPALGIAALSSVALALVALVAWQLGSPDEATRLAAGSAVETTHASMDIAPEEGTTIELAPESRVAHVASSGEDVTVSLDRGHARFDVARRPSRSFRVEARTGTGEVVEVRVIGTAFRVAHEGGGVSVQVERGIVEVRSGGELARLTAGASWRSSEPQTAVEPVMEVLPAQEHDVIEVEEEAPAARSTRELAVRAREPEDARALFEQAREARQAGSIAEAARLYDELVREHAEDPRADVAAFELARLRMDHLDDPRGALRAIDRALAGGGAFREDAMARRAVLLDRLGRDAECRTARDAYLAAFGAGVHRASVGDLCP